MARKKSRRRGRSGFPIAAVIVLALGVLGGWLLLGPRAHGDRARTVAQREAAPLEVLRSPLPETSPVPAATTATPEPVPTETPSPLTATPPPAVTAESPAPARTAATVAGGPKLALIVDDCGQWIDTERGFLALDVPITMSVLPDVHYTAEIAREAADAGKGVMLHLPMETLSGMDPGPGKVTTEMSDSQITDQVEKDLAQVPLAAGVNNHEGSKGSADPRVMRDVVDVLAKHGDLFFIDSRTNAASVGQRVAGDAGVPSASRDVFLDNKLDVAYTEAQLREAAAIAKRTGSAIAIGHPRATTLEAVRALIPELQADGIEFVLARQLVTPAAH